MTPAAAGAGGPPLRRWPAVLTVVLGIGMSVLDSSMVTLALPEIVRDLGIHEVDAVWLVNAYQIAVLVLLLPASLAGDLFGYRRVYLAGVGLFGLASAGCWLAQDAVQLTLARALLGAGSAGLFAVNAALVRAIYPRERLGAGIALNSAVVATGSVAGPAVAALILSHADWPALFVPGVPIAAIVLALGWRALPTHGAPADTGRSWPWVDIALNGAMFLSIFFGAQWLVPHGAQSPGPWTGLALMLAGVAVGIVYVRRQRARTVPLLPVDLLAIPVFRLSMLTSVAAFCAQTLAFVSLPFLLVASLQRGAAEVGWLLAAWPLGTVLVAPLAARLIGRVAGGLLGGVGLALLAIGLLLLARAPTDIAGGAFAWRLALCGVGFGLFQAPNNHTIVTSAPAHRAGGAGGMLSTARLTGQTLGSVSLGLLYGLWALDANRVPAIALGVAAVVALAGSIASTLRLRA